MQQVSWDGRASGTKRVRFSETPEIKEFSEFEPASKRPTRPFDPMEALEGEISGVCLAEGSGGMDATQAAASRAAARKHQLLAGFEGTTRPYLGDVESAEADYDEPEEMFNDAGVPFEPFHLKREREEGYFDEDGNYVEYKGDDLEDAWADELATVEVDEEWLARVMRGRGREGGEGAASAAAGDEPDLSTEQIRSHKLRIMDMLLPGENVLQALRRLAQVRRPVGAANGVSGGGVSGKGQASPTTDPLTRHPRGLASQAMPAAVKEKFEQLTDLSSILMDQGEYGVHSMTREQLERSIAGSDGGAASGPAGSAKDSAGAGSAAALGGAAAAARTAAAAAGGAHQLAEQLLAAAGGLGQGLNGGSNGQNGAASSGGDGGDGEQAAPLLQAAVDADEDIFGDGAAEVAAPGAAGQLPAAAAAAQAQQQEGDREQHRQQPAGSAAVQQQQVQHDAAGDTTMHEPQPAQPAAQQQAVGQRGQQDQGQLPSQQQQQAAAGIGASAAAAAAAAGVSGGPKELDGFLLDSSTGLWYNSGMGCYYDPARRLFGDASSGHWFTYDAGSGQYQLAS